MIELNRDQNHAELVRYDAATGSKDGVIYEEKHPKYVEPQHGLLFLPWDSSKFIYQSQRDGYNQRRHMPRVCQGHAAHFRRVGGQERDRF